MFIIFLLFVPSVLIVLILWIFGNNKIKTYDCHILGCNESFHTMRELVDHLINVHDYKIDMEDYNV